jgi:hypothetical protein
MKIWEPKPPGIPWATPGLLRDSFTFAFTFLISRRSFYDRTDCPSVFPTTLWHDLGLGGSREMGGHDTWNKQWRTDKRGGPPLWSLRRNIITPRRKHILRNTAWVLEFRQFLFWNEVIRWCEPDSVGAGIVAESVHIVINPQVKIVGRIYSPV